MLTTFNQAARNVYLEFKERLDNGTPLLLSDLCKHYRECLVKLDMDPDTAKQTRSFYVKKKMIENFGDEIAFYSQIGLPDIVCSSSITMGDLVREMAKVSESDIVQNLVENDDGSDYNNDSQILHRAVSIIRRDLEKLQPTTEYPNTQEIDLY